MALQKLTPINRRPNLAPAWRENSRHTRLPADIETALSERSAHVAANVDELAAAPTMSGTM